MGLRRRGIALTVLAIAVVSGLAALARPSSTAADGFEKGALCGYLEPGAVVPPPTAFSALTGTPHQASQASFTDSEPLPTSNFTATASWGDGTTTPATIEWEPHLPWSAGAVMVLPSGVFVITATHTYQTEYNGPVTTYFGPADAVVHTTVQAEASPPAPAAPRPPAFRFVGQPILASIPSVNASSAYEIIFRLNRRLAQTRSGHIRASLTSHGATVPLASFGRHRARACYAAGADAFQKRSPKAGRRYPFTLTVQRPTPTRTDGRALAHRYFNFVSMLHGASTRLGC
jgi:hypothetical protein